MLFRKIDVEGEFEMLWKDVEETGLLSFDILDTVPNLLSEKSKKKLIKMRPEEVVKTIKSVIDKINAGSKETMDTLIQKEKDYSMT